MLSFLSLCNAIWWVKLYLYWDKWGMDQWAKRGVILANMGYKKIHQGSDVENVLLD